MNIVSLFEGIFFILLDARLLDALKEEVDLVKKLNVSFLLVPRLTNSDAKGLGFLKCFSDQDAP